MPSVIGSCVINLKTDYAIDSIEHHLNNALVIRREIDLTPPVVRVLEHALKTSIDTVLSAELRTDEEVLHWE